MSKLNNIVLVLVSLSTFYEFVVSLLVTRLFTHIYVIYGKFSTISVSCYFKLCVQRFYLIVLTNSLVASQHTQRS